MEEKYNTLTQLIFSNMIDVILVLLMIGVFGYPYLWFILLFLWSTIALRELFQILVSLKRYITSWENTIEIGIVLLVGVLLFNENSNPERIKLNRNIAAFAIVLSWSELINMAARHPRFSRLINSLQRITKI